MDYVEAIVRTLDAYATPSVGEPSLVRVLEGEAAALKDVVLGLKLEQHARGRVRDRVLSSLDGLIRSCLRSLRELHGPLVESAALHRKTELEKLLASLVQAKLTEEVGAWRDVSALERDLRVAAEEYRRAVLHRGLGFGEKLM